jgi:thymidine kinase
MQLRMLVDEDHIPVMAFGLRSDFQRKAFPGSMALFELADIIDEIRTVCRCMKKASFNARLINGKMVFEGSQVAIDGEGDITYIPLCGACYRAEELKAKG